MAIQRLQGTPKPASSGDSSKDAYEPDLTKPLVFQVGYLGDRYDDWVHKPVVSKNGPRLFEWDFFESLTNTYWWMIPVIWLPVVAYSLFKSLSIGTPPALLPAWMVLGMLIWSCLEYCLHRFLFHFTTSTYWPNTIHYLLHGCHHKHPQDPYRLVFPPALALVLMAVIIPPFALIFPKGMLYGGVGGGLLGYVIYDVTHFWCHFGLQTKIEPVASMRRYHLAHHFKHPDVGYGITSTLWDHVFGTYPQSAPKK